MTSFTWGGATHTGQVRAMNQDNLLTADGLFAVADGMGGHLGGEVASERAVQLLKDRAPAGLEALIDAVRAANLGVHTEAAGNPELRGMGTTLVAVVGTDDGLGLINVGDSRIYLYRAGVLKQLSEDHSLVETMVRRGEITAEAALTHPQRNVVLRALGVDSEVDLDAWTLTPAHGDRLVLCSDGLFNEVSGVQIAGILESNADPQVDVIEFDATSRRRRTAWSRRPTRGEGGTTSPWWSSTSRPTPSALRSRIDSRRCSSPTRRRGHEPTTPPARWPFRSAHERRRNPTNRSPRRSRPKSVLQTRMRIVFPPTTMGPTPTRCPNRSGRRRPVRCCEPLRS